MKPFLFCLFILITSAQAQIVAIPDAQFKNALLNYIPAIDTNANGEIEEGEAQAVITLNIAGQNVRDLTGIKSFINLQTLNCNDDRVSNFDVSGMAALQDIQCSSTQGLNYGSYFSLNVSGCTNLISLSSTFNRTTNLDLTGCSSLKNLIISSNTDLTNLDLSSCVNLEYLDCISTDLSVLNLSHNPALNYLQCSNLNYLGFGRLPVLDVSHNPNLQFLYCGNDRFVSLDVSHNPRLRDFQCGYNLLTTLNLSNAVNLVNLDCSNNLLPALDISTNTILYQLSCGNNLLAALNVSVDTSMAILDCKNNRLSNLDVTANPHLNTLYASNNLLTSIDFSNCPVLSSLECGNNLLSTLDLSNTFGLNYVKCENNLMTNFILAPSYPYFISTINCSGNLLTTLDVSQCPGLYYGLQCQNNHLTYLNIHNGANELQYTVFPTTGSVLDFSNNPQLSFICADDFQLTQVRDSAVAYGLTNTVVTDNCVLPLSLIQFTAAAKNNDVKLNWQTAFETNTSHFGIQRSVDGRNFITIGTTTAAGFSSNIKNYQFTDVDVLQPNVYILYYRLQMVDRDGKFTYSAVKKVMLEKISAVKIYPNPAKDNITISFSNIQNKTLLFNLYNAKGQLVQSSSAKDFNKKQMDVSMLPSGLYHLEIIAGVEVYNRNVLVRNN